ncbi:ANK_REP_REGION domain-containing protein [Caenorhabditis elegans]|nr:ANK_REP_REGION domain-containing protein [Caenorhabditis elegans]CAJ90506.1 ANK_REP_REGION domain-containing protein [Caenorhabditis elegans]|eukprot:NP_001041107.1 Osm-9 and Capsaicin receptor-Related [Caenorhabditis elegans]
MMSAKLHIEVKKRRILRQQTVDANSKM